MSDNIDIPLEASDGGSLDRMTAALDRVIGRLEMLGTVSGPEKLTQQMAQLGAGSLSRIESQMAQMQASMAAGFAAMEDMAESSAAMRLAAQARASAAAVIANEKAVNAQINADRIYAQAHTDMQARQLQADITFAQAILAADAAAHATQLERERKQQYDLAGIRGRADAAAGTEWERFLAADAAAHATQLERERKQQYDLAGIRGRADLAAGAEWEKFLAADAAAHATQLERERKQQYDLAGIRASAAAAQEALAERQRALNTGFLTATPGTRLQTATQASVYGGLGGDASEKYGSLAASANIAALRAEHEKLQPAIRGTTQATEGHNHAMNEGHALARGLAGSLGGLWLTYGSVIPLVAGAALASSLKHIVTVGKEVEQQLNFVFALSAERKGVDLNQFIAITDTSLRSVAESANAMRALAQNGLEASQSLSVLPSILNLATVGEMSVGQAALAATGATSAFGLSMSEAGRVSDIFAKAAATSNTSVLAITESMKQASTVASLFHVSIEETAGMLGLLAKINVTGGAAGTSLTNMLTGLYEPTQKGKAALKELGVETHTATGALKPLTTLLSEMKMALAGLNDSTRVDILGSIFTVRGVKSAELALSNLGELEKKIKEAATASGYMRTVVAQLEDSTTGAFARLGVAVENTFKKSFDQASPYIQQLALHLGSAFKDEATASGLANLSTNVARLTGFLFENLGAVLALGAAYIGLRALGPVIELFRAAAVASAALTAAQAAATAASIAHTSALAGGASTLALFTAATETQTIATSAAAAASTAWGAVLLPTLAAVGIAVAAGAALWLLFRNNTDEADRANVKIGNSLHVVGEHLEAEIKRLERVNALWDARNSQYRKEGSVTPELLSQAENQVKTIESRILKSGGKPDAARNAQMEIDPGTGIAAMGYGYHELTPALLDADAALSKLLDTSHRAGSVMLPQQALETVHNATRQLKEDLVAFGKLGTEQYQGKFYQPKAEIRDVYAKSVPMIQELEDPSKKLTNLVDEQARLDGLRVGLKQYKDEVNSLQAGRLPKDDTKGANDQYRAAIEQLKNDLSGVAKQAQTGERDIESAYKQGTISAIDRYQRVHDLKVAELEVSISISQQEESLAARRKNGLTDVAKFQKQASDARRGIIEEDAALERRLGEDVNKVTAEGVKFRVDELRKQGSMSAAFSLENAEKVKALDLEVTDSATRLTNALAGADQKKIESAARVSTAATLARQRVDAELAQIGSAEAAKNLEDAFTTTFGKLKEQVAEVSAQSTSGSGLSAVFSHAMQAEKLYSAGIGAAIAKQRELQALASAPGGTPAMQKAATSELVQLDAEAAKMRSIWVSVGKSIEKSLTDAFGNAGKALGGLMSITIAHAETEKQINTDLEKSRGGTDFAQKQIQAARDLDSAQVTAYGNMAGAAKDFFEQGSSGYRKLETVERAFHAVSLAMTLKDMVAKLFSTTTVTTAKVTGLALEGGAAVASIAPVAAAEAAKSSAYGITALAASLALPFPANLGAFAVVAGMLAAIGVIVSGGGGSSTTAADRQKEQGTGTVLGDPTAKSASIENSLKLLTAQSATGLDYSAGMLDALKSISSGLTGLGRLVAQGGLAGGKSSPFAGIHTGTDVMGGSAALGASTIAGAVGGAAVGTFYGMAAGAIGGPIGMAIGAVLGTAIGYIASKLTNVKSEITDQGLNLGPTSLGQVMQSGVQGSAYADVQQKKSFLGITYSNKTDQASAALDPALQQQFTQVALGIRSGIVAAAAALGAGGDAFVQKLDAIPVEIGKISLKGLTPAQVAEQLTGVFSKMGDKLAAAAGPVLTDFAKVGEGAMQTLVRVAADYQAVDQVMSALGKSFDTVGVASIGAREHLIDLAGGLDEFTTQSSFFVKNFLTSAEQIALAKKQLDPMVSAIAARAGAKTPAEANITTLDQYAALVKKFAGDTTSEGMFAYAELMKLAPAFKTMADAIKQVSDEGKGLKDQYDNLTMSSAQLAAKQRALLDVSNRALFDQVEAAKLVGTAKSNLVTAYNAEKAAIDANITRVEALGNSWKKFRDSLLLGDLSPLTPGQKYAEARSQFETTKAAAQGGDVLAQANFESVASAFLKASKEANASGASYMADFAMVRASTSQAIAWAATQVDVAKVSLDVLHAQVDKLVDIKSLLQTVNESIIALSTARGGFAALSGGSTAIESLYEKLLGRQADPEGMAYWQSAMIGGMSLADIARQIAQSAEYLHSHPGIAEAPLTTGTPAPVSNAPTKEQFDMLIKEIAELRAEQQAQTEAIINSTVDSNHAAAATVADSNVAAAKAAAYDNRTSPEFA